MAGGHGDDDTHHHGNEHHAQHDNDDHALLILLLQLFIFLRVRPGGRCRCAAGCCAGRLLICLRAQLIFII